MEYLTLFLIGLSYGSTACMFSCMPFLSPLLLTHTGGVRGALPVVTSFSMGRILSYTLIAAAASFAAAGVKAVLDDATLSQTLLGIMTLAAGGAILYRSFAPGQGCAVSCKRPSPGLYGAFGIGVAMALNPCVPLLSLVALAAGSANTADALAMGIFFGLGAVAASWLFFGLFLNRVAKETLAKLPEYKTVIERIAALLLMAVGVAAINGALNL